MHAGEHARGQVVAGYELLVGLFSGGAVTTWAARHVDPVGRRIFAMRLLAHEGPPPKRAAISRRRLTSSVPHPHVAAIVDFGEHSGVLFQVTKWFDAEPLSDLLDCGSIPVPLARCLAAQVSVGLEAVRALSDVDEVMLAAARRAMAGVGGRSPLTMRLARDVLVGHDGVARVVGHLHSWHRHPPGWREWTESSLAHDPALRAGLADLVRGRLGERARQRRHAIVEALRVQNASRQEDRREPTTLRSAQQPQASPTSALASTPVLDRAQITARS